MTRDRHTDEIPTSYYSSQVRSSEAECSAFNRVGEISKFSASTIIAEQLSGQSSSPISYWSRVRISLLLPLSKVLTFQSISDSLYKILHSFAGGTSRWSTKPAESVRLIPRLPNLLDQLNQGEHYFYTVKGFRSIRKSSTKIMGWQQQLGKHCTCNAEFWVRLPVGPPY